MSARVAALIAAAGEGQRLGSGPKALLRLGERTLLQHAIAALADAVDEVVVAVPAARLAELAALQLDVQLVAGGRTRQESVKAMLVATRCELVVVHDVARPFLPRNVLRGVIDAALEHGAATAAVPVADTVVEAAAGYGAVLDRDRLRAIQTPQAFDRQLLVSAHRAAASAGLSATDDAGLVRAAGHPVELVAGSRLLFKITEPEDLLLAESLLPRLRASGW